MRKRIGIASVACLAISGSLSSVLLLAAPAGAGTTVGPVTTDVTPNTAAASATYTVGFTTSSSGALPAGTGTVTLTGPVGTAFPTRASSYQVNATPVSAVSVSGSAVTITSPVSVAASTGVSVSVLGVTNPAPGTDNLVVTTSADTAPAAGPAYPIEAVSTPQTAVANVSATPSLVTAGAALVTYSVGFDTSASGALGAGTGTITLAGPPGMRFTSTASDYTVNGTAPLKAVLSNYLGTVTLTLGTASVAASSGVTVVAKDASNAPLPGYFTFGVSTSADADPAASTVFSLYPPPTAVSSLTVTVDPAVAGQQATYNIGFDTSDQGALAAGGTVTVSAPAGTAFPAAASDYSLDGVAATSVAPASTTGGTANQVTITVGAAVPAQSAVALVVDSVGNPPAGSNDALTLATSSDTVGVRSGPYTIAGAPPGTVTNLAVNAGSPTAGQLSTYTVGFATSSAGALAGPPLSAVSGGSLSGDTVTLAAPVGTSFSTKQYSYRINGAEPSAISLSPSGASVTLTLDYGQTIGDSSPVTVLCYVTGNPATPGYYTLSVHTSADPNPATSSPYYVAPS
ncbi:MAG: beta strand repeat-containing protein [Mycobacteriales bacterium]